MPYVNIQLTQGATRAQKAQLVRDVTDSLVRVLGGTIPLRQRELLINRTCARCGCEYAWGVHVAFFGERGGFTPEELWATVYGAHSDPVWAAEEQLFIRLAHELHETATVSEALWQALST